MQVDDFWRLIEAARAENPTNEGMLWGLRDRLHKLSVEQLVAFQRHFDTCLAKLYRWDIWGAAYVMNGGCSDDAFEYWRAMLISLGREAYETALREPDALGDLPLTGDAANGDWDFEEFIHLPGEVYEEKTDHDITRTYNVPADPPGEPWSEETVNAMYPRIDQRFWEDAAD